MKLKAILEIVGQFKDFDQVNPYLKMLQFLQTLEDKGGVLDELSLSSLLNGDYIELFEQAKTMRNE